MQKWRIGIDEAGRGPLAGPVAVGAVLVTADFDWQLVSGVDDSKKLSEARRNAVFDTACSLKRDGVLDWQVTLIGPQIIDDIGIVPSVRKGIARTIAALEKRNAFVPKSVEVLLDGALRAPTRFGRQRTIIGGDGLEQCIGLASILAKVRRDRYMTRLAKRYPQYEFAVHKGYGTKRHCACILEHGLSDVHRRSFCRGLRV
ncbi:MAG: ribonuclease HII [Candidatus Paceibacterota bacterium]